MTNSRTSAILFGLLLCIFVIHALYLSGIAEDAFISFRYAEHLAAGSGLVWNTGEAPIEGYSNYLWVVLCALAVRLGFDLLAFTMIAGLLAGSLTMFYAYIFTRDILGAEPVTALVPPLMLAASGPFAAWAASGMETNLFALFVLAGLYHACRFRISIKPRSWYLASLLLFLATLTRPEGMLVFAVILAWTILSPGGEHTRRFCVRPAALYAVCILVYTIWRYNYFGMLLPNTFYAKTGGGWRQYARGVIYVFFFTLYFIGPLLPALFVFFRTAWSTRRTNGNTRFGIILCLAVIAVYSLYIAAVGGDYMAMYRFFVPLLAPIYLVFAASIAAISRMNRGPRFRISMSAIIIAFALAFTAVQSTPLEKILFYKPPRQHGTWRGIQTERWHVARLSLIGAFFHTCLRTGGESIATPAIGAISFYSGMEVYGFFGLTDRHIARQRVKTPGSTIGWPGHEKEDFEYLFSKKPTFVIFSRALTAAPLPFPTHSQFSLADQLDKENGDGTGEPDTRLDTFMRNHYDLTSAWLIDKKNQEEGYFTFLERKQRYRRTDGTVSK